VANLEAQADQAVREAVDAFMAGRLLPEFDGETVFETQNSRYRLLDGVVFSAPDAELVGAELVGWLTESSKRSVIGSSWLPGARAVLVDRRRGRNIIVTSTTRMLHLDDPGADSIHPGSEGVHPDLLPPRAALRAAPLPQFSSQSAAIVAATPLPLPVSTGSPVGVPIGIPGPATPRPSPFPPRVHAPPRPIARVAQPVARPLPYPMAPPRRDSPPPPRPIAVAPVAAPPPAAGTAWELTSAEFEIEIEPDPPGASPHRNAERHDTIPDAMEAFDHEAGPTSTGDAFPLVRPRLPGSVPAPPRG
jgi:hypothetical protein